jgi:hypothetical protein
VNNNENVQRPGFLDCIVGAFTRPELYDRFRRIKLASSISFLALLLFLVILVGTVHFTYQLGKGLEQVADYYHKNLPEIKIKDGKVLVEREMPFILKPEKDLNGVIIIDTTGKINNLDDYNQGILLKENELIYKENKYNTRTYSLSEIKDFTINGAKIMQWKKMLVTVLFPLILIFWYFFKLMMVALQVLIFGLVSKIVADSKKFEMPFVHCVNIAIFAAVPPMLVLALLDLIGIGNVVALGGLTYYAIYIYYVLTGTGGAIKAAASSWAAAGGGYTDLTGTDGAITAASVPAVSESPVNAPSETTPSDNSPSAS